MREVVSLDAAATTSLQLRYRYPIADHRVSPVLSPESVAETPPPLSNAARKISGRIPRISDSAALKKCDEMLAILV
jgi:hypothetical protein